MTTKRLNEGWHKNNPMPENASTEERIEWHLKHFRACGCRDIPFKLKKEMQKRNIKIPKADRR